MLMPAHAIGDQKQAKRRIGIVGVFIARAAQTDMGSVSEFDHGRSLDGWAQHAGCTAVAQSICEVVHPPIFRVNVRPKRLVSVCCPQKNALRGRSLESGGEGGIRTHGTLTRTPDFESGTFDHSATSPKRCEGLARAGHDTCWRSR